MNKTYKLSTVNGTNVYTPFFNVSRMWIRENKSLKIDTISGGRITESRSFVCGKKQGYHKF